MFNDSIPYKIFRFFNTIFMLLIIVIMAYPYLNVITKSFDMQASASLSLIPKEFTLQSYKMLLKDSSIYNAAWISVSSTIVKVVLSLLVQFTCAYAMTKKGLIGKKFITWMFMLPMYISAGTIPIYISISNYGLLNNFWVYILPGLFSFYNVVIIRTFIQTTIPISIEESAKLDGANEVTIFARIVLPLCKPILATVALWIMVATWNNYTTTLMYVTKSSLFNLQYKMMQIIKEGEELQRLAQQAEMMGIHVETGKTASSESVVSAQVVITTVPIICVYPFLQKYFVKGMTVGAVKD